MDDSKKKELINYLLSESNLISSSDEYVKAALQEEGFNYDKLKSEGSDVIAKLMLKARAAAAKQDLAEMLKTAKAKFVQLQKVSDATTNKIQELFNAKFGQKYAFNFRDLKNMSEKDAISILSDFEILDFLENHRIENEKRE
jgi:transposase